VRLFSTYLCGWINCGLLEYNLVKNIISKGFFIPNGQNRTYPAGQSSASYIFDLNNEDEILNAVTPYKSYLALHIWNGIDSGYLTAT